jgi:hypothetical protein
MLPIHAELCPTLVNMLVIIVGGIPIAMPTVLSVTLALGAYKLARVRARLPSHPAAALRAAGSPAPALRLRCVPALNRSCPPAASADSFLAPSNSIAAVCAVQEGAIVARMSAVEEMAGMDILCSDKTGTLTLNELTVDKPNVLVTVPGMPVDEVRSRCGSAALHVLHAAAAAAAAAAGECLQLQRLPVGSATAVVAAAVGPVVQCHATGPHPGRAVCQHLFRGAHRHGHARVRARPRDAVGPVQAGGSGSSEGPCTTQLFLMRMLLRTCALVQ